MLSQRNPATVEIPKSLPSLFATCPCRLKALSVDGVVGLFFTLMVFAVAPMVDSFRQFAPP